MIEFGQPLALFGGLALSLPILAHMAYRRITEKRLFPSLRFLSPTTIPRSGRKRPSDWPLLLLRLLLFTAIVLILADPYLTNSQGDAPVSASREQRMHLIDTSISMSGWGAWEEVRENLLEQWSDESVDHGMLAFDTGGLKLWNPGIPVDELRAALNELKPIYSPYETGALFTRLSKLWRDIQVPKKVLIYSDFQSSDWQDVQADVGALGAELFLVPTGHREQLWKTRSGNRALVDARAVPAGLGKVGVWAVVRNWDFNATPVQLSIFAGGIERERVEMLLPAQGTEQAHFTLPAGDFASAIVRIDGEDACSWDNNRSLWVMPPPARGFAFLNHEQLNISDLAEKEFLQAVMDSVGDGVWNRWSERSDSDEVECLLIPGFSDWAQDDGVVEELKNHLERGGVALLTPAESYVGMNQTLRESKLLDFTFNRVAQTEFRMDPYRIKVLAEENPLSAVFSGDSARDLYLTKVRKFLFLRDWEDQLDAPLFDREGRPLALVRNFPNGGKLVFLCFRLLPEWTDLPTRNSFLPLLVELCGLSGDAGLEENDDILTPGALIGDGDDAILAKDPGLYRYAEKRISVHAPLSESLPEVISKEELMEALNGSRGVSLSPDLSLSGLGPDHSRDQPLWMWFALAAGVLLIVENMISAPRSGPLLSAPSRDA